MDQSINPPEAKTEIKDRSGKLHPIVWLNYIPRASGWIMGMFIAYTVLLDMGLNWWLGALLLLSAFAWPHLALLISRNSKNPKTTETRLLYLDSFFTGCWQPLLFFQPWAVITTVAITLMGNMAINGFKAYALGIVFMIVGAGLVSLIVGIEFVAESTLLTIVACMITIFLFTGVMSYLTYIRSSRLIHIKKQQRELNVKLYRMYELIKTASSSLKLLEIVERITPELKAIFKFDTIFILKYNQATNTLKYHRTISEVINTSNQEKLKKFEIDLNKESSFVKEVLERQDMVYIPDFLHEITMSTTELEWFELAPFFSVLLLPILNEGEVTGVIGFQSHEKKFYLSEIDLLEVRRYASQVSLMINNSLLYEESRIAERTIKKKNESLEKANEEIQSQRDEVMLARDNLQKALDDLKNLQIQLIQQEKLASLGQLTAGIAHEIKNPLNFVNNFSEVSIEMLEEADEVLSNLKDDPEAKEELKEILGDIGVNLNKIREHGTRADRIVKSMLEHSRGGTGQKESLNLNSMIREYVNLSFHGMRAGKTPINVDIELDLDDELGSVLLVAEDFSRVLLNICNNAFDAMRMKMREQDSENNAASEKYIPKLTVRARRVQQQNAINENNKTAILLEIEDNGPGIPDELKDKVLQPFFTTKKGTEGTGLGLSITHDIIKAHGGNLEIVSSPQGTTFKITLPQ